MKNKELQRCLKESSKEELIKVLLDIYKKNKFVKDYFISKFSSDTDLSILIKYKDIIENEFFPYTGFGKGRIAFAKKAISEYKKISNSKHGLIDIMLHYVEIGVQYTNEYGDIDEVFYSSIESMYERALKFMVKHKFEHQYKERCYRIVNDTRGIGWGFHDGLCEIYYTYIDDDKKVSLMVQVPAGPGNMPKV